MGSKYVSAFYSQNSSKMQLLNKLLEILHKFVSLLFKNNISFKDCFLQQPNFKFESLLLKLAAAFPEMFLLKLFYSKQCYYI